MRALLAAILLICAAAPAAAQMQADQRWHITKTEWTEADEKGFGDFVRAIAESGCTTTIECMRGSANPFHKGDPPALEFDDDCAKWVYMLRAYYASKNGLPFAYVSAIGGHGSDIRFTDQGNRILARRELIDHGEGLSPLAALSQLHEEVSSATYRTDATDSGDKLSDFYSPKIAPGSIRAGTVLYDVNGHVGIVYDVDADGRVLYMDADPDHTVDRSVYGGQFGDSQAALGGGFKNFRPLKLVDAKVRPDGSLIGGRIVPVQDSEITDFSLEQYRGVGPNANGDGVGALFPYRGRIVSLVDYVRGTLSGGTYSLDPARELSVGMDSLCQQLRERGHYIDAAITAGIGDKPHSQTLPGNIYASDDDEWEAYATPSRDARLKDSFAQLDVDVMKSIFRAEADQPGAATDVALKQALEATYAQKAKACSVTYTNSAGAAVSFGFDEGVRRLFLMSFDPYDCIERRWGASDPKELESCKDDADKTAWYNAEQNLRNQAERNYGPRSHFTLAELEKHIPGSGTPEPPPVDIAAMISHIGREPLMGPMSPVGF